MAAAPSEGRCHYSAGPFPQRADAPVKAHAVVAVPASMAAYARGVYGFLRELDQQGCDLIVASLPVEAGLGLTIVNRLHRAAGPRPTY